MQLLIFIWSFGTELLYSPIIQMIWCFLSFIIFAALFIIGCVSVIKPISISNSIFQPKMQFDKIPISSASKSVKESFVRSIKEVNFELSSSLYIHEGSLSEDNIYNNSFYQLDKSRCRIYKTDLKVYGNQQFEFESPPEDNLVIEYNKVGKNGEFATVYVAHENNTITVFDLQISNINANKLVEKVDMLNSVQRIRKGKQNITLDIAKEDEIHLLNIDRNPYIIITYKMYKYDRTSNKILEVVGYSQPQQDKTIVSKDAILEAQVIGKNSDNRNTQFYVMTSKEIKIYDLKNPLKVEQVQKITDMKDANLLASTYDNGYFYVTSLNKLFLIDFNDPEEYKVYSAHVNGSCNYIQKFQTTLHLGCVYDKIYYIAEFFTIKKQISLNRYYSDEDIEGRALVRRIGMGKMAILTDKDLKITNYALNRHALEDNGAPQPVRMFSFRFNRDLVPINVASSEFLMTLVLFCDDKFYTLKIYQNPPQLNCDFSSESWGTSYHILMQFNTTRCSDVQYDDDPLTENIENVCQISVPIYLQSKQIQLTVKHTNFLQVILAVVFILLFAFVLFYACYLTFKQLAKAVEEAKGGFKKKDIPQNI